jgi:hypothetical protein
VSVRFGASVREHVANVDDGCGRRPGPGRYFVGHVVPRFRLT